VGEDSKEQRKNENPYRGGSADICSLRRVLGRKLITREKRYSPNREYVKRVKS